MSNLPENFCVAPFLQLTTHPTKSFSPCPYLGGTTWNKVYDTISDRWTSEDLELLRQDFLNNKKPDICNRCWHEEDHNKKSLRLRLFDPTTRSSDYSVINNTTVISELINGLDDQTYLNSPRILTIKNGNVCNAKCRVCHPNDSSRWISDASRLKDILGKQYYAINQNENNWSDIQIEEIFELSKNLVRLELFGGEPLYNKKVLQLLERIATSGHSHNLTLYINTNGSVNLIKQIPSISKFKEVEIGVSIDDLGKRFEYIRHGVEFADVINNIKSWQHYFADKKTKFFIDSITTVSIFNVMYLPEIKDAVKKLLPQAPFWNLLIHPDHLFIKNMPTHVKEKVIARLSTDPEEFDDLINVINQPADSVAWDKFLEITNALDSIRKENFALTFPELSRAIAET